MESVISWVIAVIVLLVLGALGLGLFWVSVKSRLDQVVDKKAPPEVQQQQIEGELIKICQDLNSPSLFPWVGGY